MSVSVNEVEWKYDLPSGADLPCLDGLRNVASVRGPAEETLDAQYFDTADLRLIRAGITLRRRTGGTDSGWHLKLPTGPGSRREIQLPPERPGHPVPDELADLVRSYVRREPLTPVVRMVTKRQVLALLDKSGESLAEVVADDVEAAVTGSGQAPARWREAEVELTGGQADLLRRADKVLRSAGLTRSGRSAKLERALGLGRAERAGQADLTAKSPAGRVIQAYLRDQVDVLTSLDPMVRQDQADSVHQMRVATRRIRSTLRTFKSVMPPLASRVRAELKWLGDLLGDARDAEVLNAHLRATFAELAAEQVLGPVPARLDQHFGARLEQARRNLLGGLGSDRYLDLLDALDALTAGPLNTAAAAKPAGQVLARSVRKPYRQARASMAAALEERDGRRRDAALHQARKAAKRARYGAEAACLALGADAARFGREMKKVQSALGDHQDTVIARQAARQLATEAFQAGENSFSYGLAYQLEAEAARRIRAGSGRLWKKASRPRYRRWMS